MPIWLSEVLQMAPSFWSFLPGVVVAVSGPAAWVAITRLKTLAEIIDAQTNQLKTLREQDRLDRLAKAQLKALKRINRLIERSEQDRIDRASQAPLPIRVAPEESKPPLAHSARKPGSSKHAKPAMEIIQEQPSPAFS